MIQIPVFRAPIVRAVMFGVQTRALRRAPRRLGRLLLAGSAMALLAGCLAPTHYTAPGFGFGDGYGRAGKAGGKFGRSGPVLLSNAMWWQRLKDPVLDGLIAEALKKNYSLREAREKVVEARATLGTVPSPDGSLQVSLDSKLTGKDTASETLGLSWMLDPWGGNLASRKSAMASYEIAAAEADAAQLLVIYNLANAYLNLRYRQEVLGLREGELSMRRRTLGLTRTLAQSSEATKLDITRSRARVADIEARLPEARAAITATQNEIAVLTGHAPGHLPVAVGRAPQPRVSLSPEVGIPADLLRNRPDIRISERVYYGAIAEIDVARAALYPTLSLTGAITVNALASGSSATSYYLGPAIQFPALPATGKARVEARHSAARQAHLSWSSTVLSAIMEVENALVDYRASTEALAAAGRATGLYSEALSLRRRLVEAGEATVSDLIDAEQELSDAEDMRAQMRFQQARAFVDLNVRLGSGSRVGKDGDPMPGGAVSSARVDPEPQIQARAVNGG